VKPSTKTWSRALGVGALLSCAVYFALRIAEWRNVAPAWSNVARDVATVIMIVALFTNWLLTRQK